MFYGAKSDFIHIENTKINYITFGRGKTPLIIIPGLTLRGVKGSLIPLLYEYRIFAKDYRVYIFDKRDFVPEGFSVNDLADDISFCMDILDIPSAHIFGASLGGMIAMVLAINHPEKVKSLVLAVTSSRNNPAIESAIKGWISLAEDKDIGGIVRDMMPKMYSEKYMKKYRILLPLLAKITKLDYGRFINLAKACLSVDCYDDLEKITCPAFVLGGMQDKITAPEGCMEIAEKLRCRIHMYEEYGHAAYEEAKDFNERIYDFFKNVL